MSGSPKDKRSPVETWRALQRQAADDELEDEMDRILALGDAELDRELELAGIDPKNARARAEQMAEDARRALVQARARELESRARAKALGEGSGVVARIPRRVAIALALAAAVAGVFFGRVWLSTPAPVAKTVPVEPEAASPLAPAGPSADELRSQAFDQCDQFMWMRCLELLDEAARVDPTSDARPEVQQRRQTARERMWQPDAHPKNDKPTGR
jgi:hypothetical protein